MKCSKFYKIGDNCYSENQINGYTSFTKWFLDTNDSGNMQSFVEWTKKNGVYEYRKKHDYYFKKFLNNTLHKYKVIKEINGKYSQNFKEKSQINDI